MLELILVRHGETDDNVKGTYCGWTDTELNEKGEKQALQVARMLEGVAPDAIYTSPLKRAYNTACAIARTKNVDIICSDNIKERNFGKWENMTYEEIVEKYPEECGLWKTDWKNYCICEGESAFQSNQRVIEFVQQLLAEHNKGTVILVTHLGCIRYLIAHFLNMPMEGCWRFRVDNGSISRLMIAEDGFAYLTALNVKL